MTQAVHNPMSGFEPQLHPRDSHGRFRDTWGIPEAAKKLIQGILKHWNSPQFKSDDHAAAYLDQQAKKKKRTPEQQASLDYFMTEEGNADIQSTLRVGKDDMPQVRNLDEMMTPLPHDLILTRVLGPDAFGLPPERMGEVEEWTGKLLMDHGYAPTNVGTPHDVPGPHITMSILAPHGTKAVVPGDGRAVILDREQPLRVTKVQPDGHGGLFMYAVVAPKQGNKEAARGLGKELAPGELSPAVEATPEELAKRGLDADGNPLPPGGAPAVAQAPAPGYVSPGPSAPTPAKLTQTEPAVPAGGSSANVHQSKIDALKAKMEADKANGKEPAKEDVKKLAELEGVQKAEPAAPEPPPIEGPDSKPGFKEKNLEPGPEHPDKKAKKEAAKAAQQETAKAEAPAAAAATVDELINKKATNQTIAEHLRAIAAGDQLNGIDDEDDRQAIRDDLESAAKAFQDDNPMEGKKIVRSVARATGVQMQGKAGEKVDYDPSLHDAVNPDGLKAGDKVEVIKAGATMRRKDGSLVHLDRAMVKRASGADTTPEAPKEPEKKTSFGAPKVSRADRLAAVKKPAPAKKAAKKAVKTPGPVAPKEFNEKDLSKNTVVQLRAHAKEKGIKVPAGTRKDAIIEMIQEHHANGPDIYPPDTPPAVRAAPRPPDAADPSVVPVIVEPSAPQPKKYLKPPSHDKFELADDPGESGDGYLPNGKWGKYGAAGVLIGVDGPDGKTRYLLVQRSQNVETNKGKWQVPGGALDSKENPYQGAAREIHEEVGARPGYLGRMTPAGEHVYEDSAGWKYTTIVADSPTQFEPKASDWETSDAKWLTEDEIRQMVDSGEITPSVSKSILGIIGDHQQSKKEKAPSAPAVPAKKAAPATHLGQTEADLKEIPADTSKLKAAWLRPIAEAHGIPTRDDNGNLRPIAEIRKELDDLRAKTGGVPVKKVVPPKPELTEAQKLNKKLVKDLRAMAEEKGIKVPPGTRKADLIKYLTGEATPPEIKPKPKPIPSWMYNLDGEELRALATKHGISLASPLSMQTTRQVLAEAGVPKPKSKTLKELKKEAHDMGLYIPPGMKKADIEYMIAKEGPEAKKKKALKQEAISLGIYHGPNPQIKDLEEMIAAEKAKREKHKAELAKLPDMVQDIYDAHVGDETNDALRTRVSELIYGNNVLRLEDVRAIAEKLGVGAEFKAEEDKSPGQMHISTARAEIVSLVAGKATAAREGIPFSLARGDLTSWKQVGDDGSTSTGIFEAPDGSQWHVKAQKSYDHGQNERHASLLYGLAGIQVPEVYVASRGPTDLDHGYSGGGFTASRVVPGAKSDLHSRVTSDDQDYLAKIYDGFAIDAWLGNWDAVGTGWDGIVTDEAGNPVRTSTDGAMAYRAGGDDKGLGWGPIATEWDSFQDPDSDRPLVQMYRGMTEEQRTRAVEALERITPAQIQELAVKNNLKDSQVKKLLQRREDILSRERNKTEAPFYAGAKVGEQVIPAASVGTKDIHPRLAASGLTADEIDGGRSAVRDYQGSGYDPINGHLRKPSKSGTQSSYYQGQVDAIDRIMGHSPLTEDVVVYRGERAPARSFPEGVWSLTGGMEGMEWTFPTYSSTSASDDIAVNFSQGYTSAKNPQPTVFRIRVPKGHNAIALDEGTMSHEHELLLPHHLRYRVVKDYGVDSQGIRRLDVEVLETSGDETE